MENGAVYLKKGEGRSMKAGGPWVYDNEVERIEGEPLDGDVVSVHDYNGFCLGKGFLNRRSKLRVRMLTRNRNQEIDGHNDEGPPRGWHRSRPRPGRTARPARCSGPP